MILPDNETSVDLLNNEHVASVIKSLLLENPEKPVTIGIHGDWGAGKSSILRMLEDQLEHEDGVLCIRFDSWRFQGFEDAKIALLESIISSLSENKTLGAKVKDAAAKAFSSLDWLKIAKYGGQLAFTAFTGMPTPDQIMGALSAVKGLVSGAAHSISPEQYKTVADGVEGVLKAPGETKRVPKEAQEFLDAFDDLLDATGVKLLVVLVDDLDRCLPKTVIETLEAMRLFLFTKKTAFVIAADERMIEYSVREHFPDIEGSSVNAREYAKNYLEKLIQIPFRLPSLGESETKIYVSLLLIETKVGEESEEFKKLIGVAREKLKSPWIKDELDFSAIKPAFAKGGINLDDEILISQSISHILANGTNGNPRQIKRFLNTLLLRKRIADVRGFGKSVLIPILAKLMLVERFKPAFYSVIEKTALSDEGGLCPQLSLMEDIVKGKTGIVESGKKSNKGEVDIEKYLQDELLTSWVQIDPEMKGVDLRPYLFVSRQDSSSFGHAKLGDRLSKILQSLFGNKRVVQEQKDVISNLSPEEAGKIFDEICTKMLEAGNFKKEPVGLEGLKLLATIHAELRAKLLDFLRRLPPRDLGMWAIAGWEDVFKGDADKAGLESLNQSWLSQDDNPLLKRAMSTKMRVTVRK